ncbi:MAG: polysaccharide biosynthesis protein [Roseburia sp.]|nr:polysaccharide biosynthesis protein [Roseburia sp.]MCM1277447.1 polysaccharide biosynthesis protein [Robinsoniella sp.]
MFKKYPLIAGTILLTATGILSRIIGFFYRIFLSQTIGEEGMGIYQLIAPVMALSFSITAAGIQTAISKFVAPEPTSHDYKSSLRVLLVGFTISLSLSAILGFFLFEYSFPIAKNFLLEERCSSLVRIFALSLPFGSVHSCINGYYYGIKKTGLPAFTQLLEQGARVLSVYFIYSYCQSKGLEASIAISVVGIVIGEFVSMAVSAIAIFLRFSRLGFSLSPASMPMRSQTRTLRATACSILSMAVPLSANRLIINGLQSVEAVYIPNRLMAFGLSNSEVLRIYGVLTGMVMPLILFPSALTSSIAVLILPYVSEAEAAGNNKKIANAVSKCIFFCLALGFLCTAGFFLFGGWIGNLLFHSKIAGSFLTSMSFICPFLYLRTVLSSILHGLGKTAQSFFFQIAGIGIKLLFVFYAIPLFGIKGYLWGLLVSELLLCTLYLIALKPYIYYNKHVLGRLQTLNPQKYK